MAGGCYVGAAAQLSAVIVSERFKRDLYVSARLFDSRKPESEIKQTAGIDTPSAATICLHVGESEMLRLPDVRLSSHPSDEICLPNAAAPE